jgi:hypothetical protein
MDDFQMPVDDDVEQAFFCPCRWKKMSAGMRPHRAKRVNYSTHDVSHLESAVASMSCEQYL